MLEFYHYFEGNFTYKKKVYGKTVCCVVLAPVSLRPKVTLKAMGPIQEAEAELFKARNMRLT